MIKKSQWIIQLCLCFLIMTQVAFADTPLSAKEAFQITAQVTSQHITVHYQIAPGYQLYKDRFNFALSENTHPLGKPIYPRATPKQDPSIGQTSVFTGNGAIIIPLMHPLQKDLTLTIYYQGCATAGFCYPPQTLVVTLHTTTGTHSPAHGWMLLFYFLAGVLLSITPCVLPMVPILSGILFGQRQHLTPGHSFLLASSYVCGIGTTYAIAGAVAAHTGTYLSGFLQTPIILTVAAVFIGLFSLSCFGLYELTLPTAIHARLVDVSGKLGTSTFFGIYAMGALSSLILSPCISPALATALTHVSTTHDHWFGAAALFLMGIGSGIWLPIIGVAGSRFLPKRGDWLLRVNVLMGVLLLAVATDLLIRRFPSYTMTLWGIWSVISALIIFVKEMRYARRARFMLGIAATFAMVGILWLMGGLQCNTDFLHPWEHHASSPYFDMTVRDPSTLDAALEKAYTQHQPVFIEFYADWCATCRGMDHTLFSQPTVQNTLQPFMKIRVDITHDNALTRALMQRWHVMAPPTMIWLDCNGHEIIDARIIGKATESQIKQFHSCKKH